MRIYQVSETDWFAARTARDARRAAREFYGDTDNDPGEVFEKPVRLTKEQMDAFRFYDGLEEDGSVSFAEQLSQMIADGEAFPTVFATKDW